MNGLVWFITKRRGESDSIGSATVLERIDGEDVADFRDRVKAKMHPLLKDWAANELEVCVLDDNNQERVLDDDESVPAADSKARALIVIAPPLRPPATAPWVAPRQASEYALSDSLSHRIAPLRLRALALCQCLLRALREMQLTHRT